MALPIKINLPDGFLDEEVRCGYTVTPKLKRIWAIELDLLNELDSVCKKHGIHYQLGYGSLLGAVRHKGFIPWDDDMDVWMSREDINKLIAHADEFKNPYFLQTPLSDRRYLSLAVRLRNSMTTGVLSWQATPDYNNGIYLDIMPMDGQPESTFKKVLTRVLLRGIVKRLWYIRGLQYANLRTFKEKLLYLLKPITSLLSYEAWYRLYKAVVTMWNKTADKVADSSSVVIPMSFWLWLSKQDLADSIVVDFEWLKVPISRNYHDILTREYGDYMSYPPLEQRGKWHDGIAFFDPDIPYKEWFQHKEKHVNDGK